MSNDTGIKEIGMNTRAMAVDMVRDLASNAMEIAMQASIDNTTWYKKWQDMSEECSKLQYAVEQKEIELVRKELQIATQARMINDLKKEIKIHVADA